MRAAWFISAFTIFAATLQCFAGHIAGHIAAPIAEDPTIIPISGELVWLDPANGRGKSLLRMDGEALGRPVVVDKTLYVASSHTLHSLDAISGKSNWQFTTDGSIFAIAVAPKQIFVGAAGTLIAVDPAGKELWRYESDLAIIDPLLADDLIIFNSVDGPVAIDQKTGKFRWRLAVQWGYFVFSQMSEHRVCVWKPDEIFVVETEHGKTLWHTTADQSNTAPGALPTAAAAVDDLICQLRGSPKDANDWSLHGREGGSGRSIWRTPLGQREAAGARTVIAGKSAYCVLEDQLSAVDLIDGKLRWQTTIKPMEAGGAALLSGHGLVYLPQLGGEVTALDEKTGKAIWIAGAPKPSPGGQIRIGGISATDAGVYVTRNDQQRR